MPQTALAISSCNALLEMDNAAGTPTDISGASNRTNLTFNRNIGSAVTFVGEYPIRVECKRDSSLEINVLWTRGNNEARRLIEDWYDAGGLRTFTVYPNAKDTGERTYSAEYFLQEFSFVFDASNADPVAMTVQLMPSGAITFGAYTS